MASKIEWTDETWSPISGCKRVSPGCSRCYAERMARRINRLPLYAGVTKSTPSGPRWTGEVGVGGGKVWTQPLRWKKPRRIFVCSMTDLFYEGHDVKDVARVFGVMLACHALGLGHTFQVLTKRANTMRTLVGMQDDAFRFMVRGFAAVFVFDYAKRKLGDADADAFEDWPLPNVWLGVSVEDQERADERIPALLETPARVLFLSCEPLLGPIRLPDNWPGCWHPTGEGPAPDHSRCAPRDTWVIAGGESGPGARPMHPDWARSLRDQCQAAGVPFLFKQWGAHSFDRDAQLRTASGVATTGGALGASPYWRVGKKAAGRELDGRTWDQFPEIVRA